MKTSRYNVCIPMQGVSLIYNCRTDEIIQADERLVDVYKLNMDHPEAIEQIAPDFYRYLCDKGFVLEDEIDEIQLILNGWKQEDKYGKDLFVTVNPTMNCNLKCYYCYEEHNKGTRMSQEILDAVVAYFKWQIQSKKYNQIVLSFFGGEPLIYFKKTVYPLLEEIRQLLDGKTIFSLHFTTNATLLTKKVLEYLKPWNPSFQITIDGNEFIHNLVKQLPGEKSAYKIAVNNIRLLLQQKLKVAIRFNYTAKTLDYFYEVLTDMQDFSDLEKSYCNINFHRIWQDTVIPDSELKDSVDALEKAFREKGFHVISSSSRTIGRCYGDKENSVVINYNGAIYKCTARNFDEEHCEGQLLPDGNIKWNERYEKRKNVRYCNAVCQACLIFPLCHGGCSQNKLESDNPDKCLTQFSNQDKQDYILRRIKDIYKEQNRETI